MNLPCQNINFKLLDFKAFTEFKDSNLIICGMYDLICYFEKQNADIISKQFTKSFVRRLDLNSMEIDSFENYEVEVNVIGAPEIKVGKIKWLDKIANFIPFIPRKVYITIKGAICCEIFEKIADNEPKIIRGKKKLLT